MINIVKYVHGEREFISFVTEYFRILVSKLLYFKSKYKTIILHFTNLIFVICSLHSVFCHCQQSLFTLMIINENIYLRTELGEIVTWQEGMMKIKGLKKDKEYLQVKREL